MTDSDLVGVQKRSRGRLRRWTNDTLEEAEAKRDAMSS